MLFKLAFRNVRRQIGDYLIYFITVSLTVAFIFSVNSVIFSDLMAEMQERYLRYLQPLLVSISALLSVVVAFVLGYATSFLLSRRKKEFGLYLTMGMTRRDIVSIFAGETAVNFLLSLGMGLLLGLGLFQGLMVIILTFLEQEVTFTSYSVLGFWVTVVLVGGIFLLSSLVSFLYLGFSKISNLLKADEKSEKTVKYPIIWFIVALIAIIALIFSVQVLVDIIIEGNIYENLSDFLHYIVIMAAAIIVLPFAVAKGVVPLLVKWKFFSSLGANIFTLRQLSSRLNANSVMLGVLSFLLSVAVVATSFSLNIKTIDEAQAIYRYPYEIAGSYQFISHFDIPVAQAVETMEKYVEFDVKVVYGVYTRNTFNGWHNEYEYFIEESAYRQLCQILDKQPKALNGGVIVGWNDGGISLGDLSSVTVDLNGSVYNAVAEDVVPLFTGSVVHTEHYYVVPDGAVAGLEKEYENFAASLKNPRYDALALHDELRIADGFGNSYLPNYELREYHRLEALGANAIVLIVALFVSVVFVLLSMAMLALKVLSMLAEDRKRYRAIWRLGAGMGALKRSLFVQIFSFFFLPFIIPLSLCAPLANVFTAAAAETAGAVSSSLLLGQIAGVACVLLALYALYFTLTYLLALQDAKKALRSAG